MLSGELASRARKLQQEQRQRAEAAQRKAEREKAVQDRLAKQREAHEQAVRQRRIAEQEAAEAERLRHEEAVEANNGVWWAAQLRAVPLDENAAGAMGIRRSADKVRLPPSAGSELLRQDSPKNGAPLFELVSTSGRSMHAGVLDYTAVEGTVGVPPLVSRNLFDAELPPAGAAVAVTYCKLPKGVYARFQPRTAGFQQEVGDEVRPVLEAALATHSALSEGAWIRVPFGGGAFELLVQKLRPGRAVSVIDTELEAEVEPSLETEQRLAAEAAAAAQLAAPAGSTSREHQPGQCSMPTSVVLPEQAEREREAFLAQRAAEALQQAAAAEQARLAEEAAAAARMEELARVRREKAAALPPEPGAEEGATTSCLIRLPDGTRLSRRFRCSDPLRLLFDFVDAKGGAAGEPGSYKLVLQFPRRVIAPDQVAGDATLRDAGLTSRQEALLVEPVSS